MVVSWGSVLSEFESMPDLTHPALFTQLKQTDSLKKIFFPCKTVYNSLVYNLIICMYMESFECDLETKQIESHFFFFL